MNAVAGLLLVASAAASSGAASLEALLEKAITAGKQKDVAAWLALDCKARPPSETDIHVITNFKYAALEDPNYLKQEGVVKELHMCLESKTQKETCLAVPVVQQDVGFCLRVEQ